MKIIYFKLAVIIISILFYNYANISAKVLNVGAGYTYSTLSDAALEAQPGDTILVNNVVQSGTQWIAELKGTQQNWIYILASESDEIVYRGNSEAWHLSDCEYLHIEGFKFSGQSGNGVNIDDAGTFETPSHHISIEGCAWDSMAANGNNDQLKLSGVDDFVIQNCSFSNSSDGGSMVDMVGCHNGGFFNNFFLNGGSNAIQAKGGSKDIYIERNWFTEAGQRAINIGGSTGAAFFRPQGINYESSNIYVHSNVFVGSQAPIAFVGTVNSEVINNTIVNPGKWAIRILQETVDGMLECSNNIFRNNIVYIQDVASNPTINIGPNTLSETFEFSNNLWYNWQNPSWGGPNLPVAETDGITGQDPQFTDYAHYTYILKSGSPAIGAGKGPVTWKDHLYNDYRNPPSIGAFEDTTTTYVEEFANKNIDLKISPNSINGSFKVSFNLLNDDCVRISIINLQGEELGVLSNKRLESGLNVIEVSNNEINNLTDGIYFVKFITSDFVKIEKVIILR